MGAAIATAKAKAKFEWDEEWPMRLRRDHASAFGERPHQWRGKYLVQGIGERGENDEDDQHRTNTDQQAVS